MKHYYNPLIHNRRSLRLKGYDYSKPGFYFITICIKENLRLFGNISNGLMNLNAAGEMIDEQWKNIPLRFPNIRLHNYIIMPDHFHAILEITDSHHQSKENPNLFSFQNYYSEFQMDSLDVEKSSGLPEFRRGKLPESLGQPQGIAPTKMDDKNRLDYKNDLAIRVSLVDTPQTTTELDRKKELNEETEIDYKNDLAVRVSLVDTPQTTRKIKQNPTLGDILDAFKSITTVEYIKGVHTKKWEPFKRKLWHRNYWDHIIRNQEAFHNISEYIKNNPKNWKDRIKE